jgi:tetratricopeptide (TPR) repeat protein
MAIDPYAACPGGTGKKIKFCCGDMVGDLEQLDRLVEGNQVAAASEMVARLEQKHPGRACLMATKVKLELAARRPAEAVAASAAFVEAHPQNPLALGQAALCEAIAGRLQESAAAFDKAREAAAEGSLPEVIRIAATLVRVAAQLGSVGFAQGLVEWVDSTGRLDAEEARSLAMMVGMAGVPPALRTRPSYEATAPDSPWRFEFDRALEHARHWRLSRALTTFKSLKGVAGASPELFTNIAILCELLARPFEAAEAWHAVARLVGSGGADAGERAIEFTARAVELEQEADPDRSPTVAVERLTAFLPVDEADAIDRLEDRLRHDPRFRSFPVERGDWVARNLAPPRSAWRVALPGPAPEDPARVLGSLLIFGRQTDREPEAILQGFAPDVAEARGIIEPLLHGAAFGPAESSDRTTAVTPTQWLLSATYMIVPPSETPAASAEGQPAIIDTLLARERALRWERVVTLWPDTPLPELLGRTPREAASREDSRLRLEAVLLNEEASARKADDVEAWQRIRDAVGLARARPVVSPKPLEEVSPMLWHRVDLAPLGLEELRGLFLGSLATGFDLAAERAAAELAGRPDASAEDRWEALGLLEERADSTPRRLEIIRQLRELAATLGANDGMIDAAELRVRLQRGEEAEIRRLLDHVGREHGRDEKVIRAVAEVLAEAGIDVGAMARGAAAGRAPAPAGPAAPLPAAEAGRLWTPGSATGAAAGGGEKKTIWTPD